MKKKLHNLLSRKFIAWVCGTIALWYGKIDGWQWIALTVLWAFSNSIDKIIALRRVMTGGENAENQKPAGIPD